MLNKKNEKTNHEKWCDMMVAKAQANRLKARPQVFVMTKPKKAEPTYTNYELREMFKTSIDK